MSASVLALLWVLAGVAMAIAVLGFLAGVDEERMPEVRHPYREDIPEWW